MFGQWRGWIKGQNSSGPLGGELLLNIDRDRPDEGRVHVVDGVGPFIADISIAVSGSNMSGSISKVVPFPTKTDGVDYASAGMFNGIISGGNLSGDWSTNVGSAGTFSLLSAESRPAMPPTTQRSWTDFVSWALSKAGDAALIYRGQTSATDALSTTFHRAGRRDLLRYFDEDVPLLRRSVEAATGASFHLDREDDRDTLTNIAQHHGFPTPLLDFTRSAFVSAYFAFAGVRARRRSADESPVRVYALDGSALPTVVPIFDIKPRLGRLQLGARLNPRVLPQQSVNVFSSVPDVEGFIAILEEQAGRRLLEAIDIPASESGVALRDLRRFGISNASLFPGLEGACRGLAEELFP